MPYRNIVTWTTLISSHLKYGSVPKAFEMFNYMRAFDESPNEYTFSVLLRACSNREFWNAGLQIHGLVVRCGLERDKFSGSSLVYMYFKGGNNIRDAWRVFDELLERDVVAWNVMISGFALVGDFCMVQRLFSEMSEVQGLKPDNSTFVSLLKCCSLLQELKQIHGLLYKFGAEVDVVVESAMVDLYAKCGDVSSCRMIFDSMEEKDNFVWSSMISGYTMNNRGEEAVHFFKDMCRQRVKLDQHVLSSTLKACVEIEDLNTGVQVHGLMIKNGHRNDCFVASVLLTLYASFGELRDVEKLFRGIGNKDIVAWNSMILAQARPGRGSGRSMELLQELRRTTILKIEGATLVAVLKSCENESDLPAGRQLHSLIVKSSVYHHTLVGNALVHMYSECRQINDAFKVFVDIVYKDDSSWSSIIGTYKQNGMESKALALCKEMLAEGINFTSYSLPLCISACSQLSAICEGKQLHVVKLHSNLKGTISFKVLQPVKTTSVNGILYINGVQHKLAVAQASASGSI
ncbi:hypothetical protein TSUD_223590 [Trifolium subterraneum]|uniref:Pentatricopeptide repeat-containing protein n=1 Tax=Trifolium subterraneum TaxID=3900 RepID=A0A2Z6MJ10_TRISU|nr:hypothetical protein TSUD_223590 [Trifolium subterraneum]